MANIKIKDFNYYITNLDWGDGTDLEFVDNPKEFDRSFNFEHTYALPGFYQIKGLVFKKAYELSNYFPPLSNGNSLVDAMAYIEANWIEVPTVVSTLGNSGDASSDFGILEITETFQIQSALPKFSYLIGLQENIDRVTFVDGGGPNQDKYFLRAPYKAANHIRKNIEAAADSPDSKENSIQVVFPARNDLNETNREGGVEMVVGVVMDPDKNDYMKVEFDAWLPSFENQYNRVVEIDAIPSAPELPPMLNNVQFSNEPPDVLSFEQKPGNGVINNITSVFPPHPSTAEQLEDIPPRSVSELRSYHNNLMDTAYSNTTLWTAFYGGQTSPYVVGASTKDIYGEINKAGAWIITEKTSQSITWGPNVFDETLFPLGDNTLSPGGEWKYTIGYRQWMNSEFQNPDNYNSNPYYYEGDWNRIPTETFFDETGAWSFDYGDSNWERTELWQQLNGLSSPQEYYLWSSSEDGTGQWEENPNAEFVYNTPSEYILRIEGIRPMIDETTGLPTDEADFNNSIKTTKFYYGTNSWQKISDEIYCGNNKFVKLYVRLTQHDKKLDADRYFVPPGGFFDSTFYYNQWSFYIKNINIKFRNLEEKKGVLEWEKFTNNIIVNPAKEYEDSPVFENNNFMLIGGLSKKSSHFKSLLALAGYNLQTGTKNLYRSFKKYNEYDVITMIDTLAKYDKNLFNQEILSPYMSKKFDGDKLIHNGVIDDVYHGVFENTALTDTDISSVKVFQGVKPMYKQLGFNSDIHNVPTEPLFWNNIIPKNYSLESRVGITRETIPPFEGPESVTFEREKLVIDVDASQEWLDGYRWPSLPKFSKAGLLQEVSGSIGLPPGYELQYGDENASITTREDNDANLMLHLEFDQDDGAVDKIEMNKIKNNVDFTVKLNDQNRLETDIIDYVDLIETKKSQQAF